VDHLHYFHHLAGRQLNLNDITSASSLDDHLNPPSLLETDPKSQFSGLRASKPAHGDLLLSEFRRDDEPRPLDRLLAQL